MFNLKFRIGTKLGISAGLGVVLVAAMVVNQQMSGGSIAVANNTMRLEAEVAKKVVETKESVRAMQLATRGMRAAKTMDQVKTGLATLNAKHNALLAQLDAAMPLTSRPEDKDRLGRIRSLGEQYYGAASEIAMAVTTLLDAQARRIKDSAEWDKTFEAALTAPAMTGLANRREVEAGLREADAIFEIEPCRLVAISRHQRACHEGDDRQAGRAGDRQAEGDPGARHRAGCVGDLRFAREGPDRVQVGTSIRR